MKRSHKEDLRCTICCAVLVLIAAIGRHQLSYLESPRYFSLYNEPLGSQNYSVCHDKPHKGHKHQAKSASQS